MLETITDYKKSYEKAQAQIALLTEEVNRLKEQVNYYIVCPFHIGHRNEDTLLDGHILYTTDVDIHLESTMC